MNSSAPPSPRESTAMSADGGHAHVWKARSNPSACQRTQRRFFSPLSADQSASKHRPAESIAHRRTLKPIHDNIYVGLKIAASHWHRQNARRPDCSTHSGQPCMEPLGRKVLPDTRQLRDRQTMFRQAWRCPRLAFPLTASLQEKRCRSDTSRFSSSKESVYRERSSLQPTYPKREPYSGSTIGCSITSGFPSYRHDGASKTPWLRSLHDP